MPANAKKSVELSGVVVAQSSISSIDAGEGVLMYRGYSIEDLAEHSTYEEVCWLLLHGELPGPGPFAGFEAQLAQSRDLPADAAAAVAAATGVSSMDMLRTVVSVLGYSDEDKDSNAHEADLAKATRLIARIPTAIACHERRRRGLEPVSPNPELGIAANLLAMLRGEGPSEEEARALDVAFIIHAEHEMNASTFTARCVAGTGADLHSAVVAAICALKGPLHGGANEAVMAMLEEFGSPAEVEAGVRGRLERKEKLFGVGHPLYRATDPRAPILRRLAGALAPEGEERKWIEMAERLEEVANAEKGLWPNVDLYAGSLYRYLGIPKDLYTPLFAAARTVGWAAHVDEQHRDNKIIRPSAEYVGHERRPFPVPAR
jgi:citrate synthase